MRKIMFMVNGLYGGGAERVLQTILDNLDYNKFDVTVYYLHDEPIDHSIYSDKPKYKALFCKYHGKYKLVGKIFELKEKIKGKCFLMLPSNIFYTLFVHGKYDVEIAFIEGESTKIISGSTNRKSKKIAWVHIDLVENPWTAFLYQGVEDEAKHYRKFDEILCVSESVRKAFISKFGIQEKKVETQYNPIDGQKIREMAMEKCPLPPKTRLRMVTAGRLVRQKGYDRLLRVVKRLKNAGYNFELYILGEGEERADLEQYILENGLSDMVYMPGFQSNPYSYMKASNLLVCSSRAEGFSTVVSEGVVLGLPVVSTDCAGVRELFGNENCGIITENNEDGLYRGLFDVMRQPELLRVYHVASLKRGEFFSLRNVITEIESRIDI